MLKLSKSIELKNASWLIGGKVVQMILSLVVGIITARYLGPDNYGVINYVSAYLGFFTALCTLGINSVIVKEFVEYPDEQGEIIGTAIGLRLLSSVLSVVMIVSIIGIVDGREFLIVALLCSLALIFQVFNTFDYWFQAQYKSKIVAITSLVGYISISAYRIILLITEKSVEWFAFATSVDYICIALLLLIFYKINHGPRISFSFKRAHELLKSSYHYILSGMMVAIYGQTDKLMLKHMLNESEVGYYSTAMAICGMWTFILAAFVDALNPTIMRLHKTDYEGYKKKNRQLYCIVIYCSLIVSTVIMLLSDYIVFILYGEQYMPASQPLKMITWYTTFSYLGVARNAWLVCEKKQKYLKYMYIGAVFINIFLNSVFIPMWGTVGAAFASLVTQMCTSIILPCFIKELRPNVKLIIEAICLRKIK